MTTNHLTTVAQLHSQPIKFTMKLEDKEKIKTIPW